MQKLGAVLGWIWAIFCGLGAMAAIKSPGIGGAVALLVCGAMSLPPLWRAIREKAVSIPVWARWAVGVVAFFAFASQLPSKGGSQSATLTSTNSTNPIDGKSDALALIEAKIEPGITDPMSKGDYPKLHAKLGEAGFKRANDLARWAAVAIARTERCSKLDSFGVSDESTRSNVRWFGYCGSTSVHDKFTVSEAQAIAARTEFDPRATAEARAAAAKAPPVEQKRDRWKDFNEAAVVFMCDELVTSSAVNRRSVDMSWGRDIQKDDDTGRVIIERDFDAANAMGGTISSRYRCEVNGDTGRVTKLMIRELTGWRKVL